MVSAFKNKQFAIFCPNSNPVSIEYSAVTNMKTSNIDIIDGIGIVLEDIFDVSLWQSVGWLGYDETWVLLFQLSYCVGLSVLLVVFVQFLYAVC